MGEDEAKQAVLDERAARWAAERRQREAMLAERRRKKDAEARAHVWKGLRSRGRKLLHDALVFTHRTGLRGSKNTRV